MLRVGLISDTHDLLRPAALASLDGCDRILHAGDVCTPEVLDRLARLAPVDAVRGNNDRGAWAESLPEGLTLTISGRRIHVVHDAARLTIDPFAEGIALVVSGHSHRPRVEERDGVAWVNPGSAGPRRFRLPVAMAILHLQARGARIETLRLEGEAIERGSVSLSARA